MAQLPVLGSKRSKLDLDVQRSTLKSAQRGNWVLPDVGALRGSRTWRNKLLKLPIESHARLCR
jgi:hypothetical protein